MTVAIKTPTIPGQGGAPASTVAPDPDGIPAEVPRHGRDGRPKIRTGSTAKFGFYSRASSFGKVIEDTYNLDRWDKRVITWGLSRDKSLLLAAQAVPAWEDRDDPALHRQYRDQLNDIVDQAREVAKSDRAAMRGTALHLLSEQADAGADLGHLDALTRAALDAWRRMMDLFDLVATETFLVHDEWGAAGSCDRVGVLREAVTIRGGDGEMLAELPAGTAIVIDMKTGRSSDYWGIGYAVQLAVYAGGTPYVHLDDAAAAGGNDGDGDDGRRPWPGGHTPHPDWALIPHVPVDNPAEAGMVWVDLRIGRACAELVAQVKAARKDAKSAFYAGEIPGGPVVVEPIGHGDVNEGFVEVMLELIGSADGEAAIDRLYVQHAEDWCDQFTAAVEQRLAALDGGSPAEPVDPGPAQHQIVDMIRAATTEGEVVALFERHAAVWSDYLGKVADARLDELAAVPVSV